MATVLIILIVIAIVIGAGIIYTNTKYNDEKTIDIIEKLARLCELEEREWDAKYALSSNKLYYAWLDRVASTVNMEQKLIEYIDSIREIDGAINPECANMIMAFIKQDYNSLNNKIYDGMDKAKESIKICEKRVNDTQHKIKIIQDELRDLGVSEEIITGIPEVEAEDTGKIVVNDRDIEDANFEEIKD